MDKPLVNRVANSGLITINLEDDFPRQEIVAIDIKQFLFQGLILREKEFRNELKSKDWEEYRNKIVLIFCSNDSIIPVWAYMLLGSYLADVAHDIYLGTEDQYIQKHYTDIINSKTYSQYAEKRIVVKGCSEKPVPPSAYALITQKLKPHAQSIMFGEPCSTVPIFKRPRKLNK